MSQILPRKLFVSKLKMVCASMILLTILVVNLSNFSSTKADKTEIQVNYEALCPDSVRFINNHLDKAIKQFKEKINVRLIPFGIASYAWNEEQRIWEFKCQHGDSECFANMLHVNEIYTSNS